VADVYNHERPTKLEQRCALLNLRSPDLDAMSGGAKSTVKLCGGDILASLKIGSPRIVECTKYYSYEHSQQIMALLAYRKYQMDLDAARQLSNIWLANLLVTQLVNTEKNWLALVEEIRDNPGVLLAVCQTVIEDVCDPHLYAGLSAREWARKLNLKHHRLWQDGWRTRYDNLRAVLHELDTIAASQIENKT